MVKAGIVLGLTCLLLPTLAAAQEQEAEADRLFREGRAALDRRDYARACEAFAESQRLDPGAGTLLNLAECRERLGDFAAAFEHSRAAQEQLSATGDDRAAIARANVQRLEPRIARIAVRVDALAPAGTRVVVDGREVAAAALAQPLVVNPGKHTVTIRRPNLADEVVSFSVGAGDTRDLVVGPEQRSAPSDESGPPWLAIAIGGAGVAALGVAAVTGIILLDKRGVVSDPAHCSGGQCDAEGLDAAEGGDALLVVNAVAWGVGVVGVGVGATLLITGAGGSGDPKPSARATAGPGWISVAGTF